MKPATTFVAEFVGTSNVIRGELAQQLSGSAAVLDPPRAHAPRRPARQRRREVSGLLHDIQYQGSATRYELKLENGQRCHQPGQQPWQAQAHHWQAGQRVQASWPREAMTALRETQP
jgi:putative spermidine/putrescine transport system ATP-binding protein